MANIFINYRRADSITVAFILYNKLVEKKHTVFIDKEAIPIGFDFAAFIGKRIKEYDVMLTLIGNQWLSIIGNNKKPRISNENDHVRLELAEALKCKTIKVIPVLIDKVLMPNDKKLTRDLKELAKINAIDFFSYEYNKSAEKVLSEIERTLNLLTSKDMSSFIKVVTIKDDRGVVYGLKAAMEANLFANNGIIAAIDFKKLDDDTEYVSKLKKGHGTYILSALYAAEQFGVTINSWKSGGKTHTKKTSVKNSSTAYLKRYTINSIDEMITHLNANRIILAGAQMYNFDDAFYDKQAAKDGLILVMPKPDAEPVASFAILILQVDLVKNRIKFTPQWGKVWGDKGFGYFSEQSFGAYVQSDKLYAIETIFKI
jgi:hypothetical protein